MNKQWNTIKNLKFVNKDIFTEAYTFGEIENQLLHITGAYFGYKEYFIQMYPVDGQNHEILYYVFVTDKYAKRVFEDFCKVYNSIEDLVMNYTLPDGLSFIDFMMTPAEEFK